MIEERLRALKLTKKMKIVEKSGQKFIQVLKNSSKKMKTVGCDDPKCLINKTKNGGNCKKNEIVYEITCKQCKDRYIGETARNGHTRSIEHINDSESNNVEEMERSVLLRHINEKHLGEKVEFEMKVIKSYQHDPLAIQCAEAVWIRNVNPSKRINNKKEYHQPGDVEIVYEKNENENIKMKKKVSKSKNCDQSNYTLPQQNCSNQQNESTQEEIHYTCDQCDYMVTQKDHLERHIERTHKITNYECDKCDYKAAQKQQLKRHKKTKHEQSIEPSIADFIQNLRKQNEVQKSKKAEINVENQNHNDSNDEDTSISTNK